MNVEFRHSFLRDVRKLRNPAVSERVKTLVEKVEKTEALSEVSGARKIRGEEHFYRIRLGDYRVGILIQDGTVVFIRCLYRRDIYRYFP